jgi:hypothetical protein
MIPANVSDIINSHDKLGFHWIAEAVDFVLANKEWAALIKDKFQDSEVVEVNRWREERLANQKTIWGLR